MQLAATLSTLPKKNAWLYLAFSTELAALFHYLVNTERMVTDITYQFASSTQANRFLNELRDWHKHEVKAKLYVKSNMVKVSYEFDGRGFDYTCSDLDDLASQYNGIEC